MLNNLIIYLSFAIEIMFVSDENYFVVTNDCVALSSASLYTSFEAAGEKEESWGRKAKNVKN